MIILYTKQKFLDQIRKLKLNEAIYSSASQDPKDIVCGFTRIKVFGNEIIYCGYANGGAGLALDANYYNDKEIEEWMEENNLIHNNGKLLIEWECKED